MSDPSVVVVTVPSQVQTVTVSVPGPPGPAGQAGSDEQLAEALEVYLAANPIVADNIEWGDDPLPTLIFENGLI